MPALTAFEVSDLERYERMADVGGGANADLVAVTIEKVDADDYSSAIWGFPTNGGQPFRLTSGTGRDNAPTWSPDGQRLAFISDRSGALQVFVMERSGGEARQVGSFARGAVSADWLPDGKRLIVSASVAMDPVSLSGRAWRADEGGPRSSGACPTNPTGLATRSENRSSFS